MPLGVPNTIQQFARQVIGEIESLGAQISTLSRAEDTSQFAVQAPGEYIALSADLTLPPSGLHRWLCINATTGVIVTLPVACRGGWVGINSCGSGTITVKDGATTLCALATNEYCWIRCIGTNANDWQWPDKVYKEKIDGTFTPGIPFQSTHIVGATFDGGGSPPTVGSVGYFVCQFSGTIDQWSIIADQSGSAVVDVWKAAGSIPVNADSIAGSEKPTLSAAQLASDTSLSTWTTTVAAGDVFGFEIESVSTCTRLTVEVRIKETL